MKSYNNGKMSITGNEKTARHGKRVPVPGGLQRVFCYSCRIRSSACAVFSRVLKAVRRK